MPGAESDWGLSADSVPDDPVEELPDCSGVTIESQRIRQRARAPIAAMVCDQVDKKGPLCGCQAELRQEGILGTGVCPSLALGVGLLRQGHRVQ